MNVAGGEVAVTLPEFQPLDIKMQTLDGSYSSGVAVSRGYMKTPPRPDTPANKGNSFSLVTRTRGMRQLPFQIRYRTVGSNQWVNETGIRMRATFAHMGNHGGLWERVAETPLRRLDEIEISLPTALP